MLFWRFILTLSNSSYLQEPLVWVLTFTIFCRFFWGVSLGTSLSISFDYKFGTFFQISKPPSLLPNTHHTFSNATKKMYMCVGYGERCHMFEPLWKWEGWNVWRPKGILHPKNIYFKKMFTQHFGTLESGLHCANPCWSKFLGPLQMQREFFENVLCTKS